MKLLRYGKAGEEKPGVLDEQGDIRDLSSCITDITPPYLQTLDWVEQLKQIQIKTLPMVSSNVRIGACVGQPGKVICVGYNSRLHTQQMGASLMPEKEMLVFLKPSSSVCGPNDPILFAPHMKKLDWEAELAIVIGKKGKYISREQAKEHILGYTCMNDLSERYLQLEGGDTQYTKGKGFDHSAPLGPYLVTRDEISSSSHLQIKLWVNDELRQDFNTRDYIHNDEAVVSYLSHYFTLYPGDVISMGSGPGSASSWGENMFLRPMDSVTLSIDGLGKQQQRVILEEK